MNTITHAVNPTLALLTSLLIMCGSSHSVALIFPIPDCSGIMKSSATPDEIPIRITEDEPLQLHTNDTPPSMFEDGNSLQDMAANEIGNENDHLLSNSIQSKSNSSWSFRALQPSPRMLVLGHKFKGAPCTVSCWSCYCELLETNSYCQGDELAYSYI